MPKSAKNEYLSARKDRYISILKNSLNRAVCLIFYSIFLVSMSQKPINRLHKITFHYTNITQDHKNYSILDNKKEDLNPVLFFIWAAVDISLRSPSTWLRLSLISPADSLLIRLKAPHLAHSFRTKMWFSPYYNKIKRIVTNVTILFIWAAVDSNHRPHPYQGCALTTWASSPPFINWCLSARLNVAWTFFKIKPFF